MQIVLEALALVLKPHDVGLDRFAFGIILLQLTKEILLLTQLILQLDDGGVGSRLQLALRSEDGLDALGKLLDDAAYERILIERADGLRDERLTCVVGVAAEAGVQDPLHRALPADAVP